MICTHCQLRDVTDGRYCRRCLADLRAWLADADAKVDSYDTAIWEQESVCSHRVDRALCRVCSPILEAA